MEGDIFCALCKRKCSSKSNLKKHIKAIHPDQMEYLESVQKTRSKTFPFSCKHCQKQFTHSRNLKYHIKTHENYEVMYEVIKREPSKQQSKQNCAMCNNYISDKKGILDHYIQIHNVAIKEKNCFFTTNEEFLKWKDNFETVSNSKFRLEASKSYKNHTYSSFVCHRSGKYIPAGKGLRRVKTQGSSKINAFCPASIKIKKTDDGKCKVSVIETHVGHQNEIGHLTLTTAERENLAVKIASKIPFDDILNDVRNSIGDFDFKRLHLLTRKDLHNIKSCYNLCSSSVRHSNDVISVQSKDVTAEVGMEDSNLAIRVDPHIDDTRATVTELSSTSIVTSDSLEEQKAKLRKAVGELEEKINSAQSQPELDIIKKCFAPINHTLSALEGSKSIIPQSKTKTPHKKILIQRRLVTTKKKMENKKKHLNLKI